MYTLREIADNGIVSNMEIGNSYLEIGKGTESNGEINQRFRDAYIDVFGKEYGRVPPTEAEKNIRMILEFTSPIDGNIWHKVIKDNVDYYIMSDNGKTFEAIIATNKTKRT